MNHELYHHLLGLWAVSTVESISRRRGSGGAASPVAGRVPER
jgi:hypothetical protein